MTATRRTSCATWTRRPLDLYSAGQSRRRRRVHVPRRQHVCRIGDLATTTHDAAMQSFSSTAHSMAILHRFGDDSEFHSAPQAAELSRLLAGERGSLELVHRMRSMLNCDAEVTPHVLIGAARHCDLRLLTALYNKDVLRVALVDGRRALRLLDMAACSGMHCSINDCRLLREPQGYDTFSAYTMPFAAYHRDGHLAALLQQCQWFQEQGCPHSMDDVCAAALSLESRSAATLRLMQWISCCGGGDWTPDGSTEMLRNAMLYHQPERARQWRTPDSEWLAVRSEGAAVSERADPVDLIFPMSCRNVPLRPQAHAGMMVWATAHGCPCSPWGQCQCRRWGAFAECTLLSESSPILRPLLHELAQPGCPSRLVTGRLSPVTVMVYDRPSPIGITANLVSHSGSCQSNTYICMQAALCERKQRNVSNGLLLTVLGGLCEKHQRNVRNVSLRVVL
ncbi:hypothetical protein JKP88DRAFT_251882 [Tribonema minus]|uniref:Uncharacterized protein n=1 Tax=Tribonema minus TaxID=303371 RepID=A0A836CLG5_9STRA|nr:hypothetical protein JKP88DRAFT_251882 [Tribonema minus]